MPATKQANIPEGAAIPDFELQSLSGDMVKLSDYRGKRLVIFFWASW
jgi:peroxiredoxin